MIYTKLISGLGNQLFQYAVGRQLSLLRNTELRLDTSFFANQTLRSFKLDNYNINASQATQKEVEAYLSNYKGYSLYDRIYRKIDNALPKYRRKYFKEDQWWIYEPDLFQATSNTYLEGYWQHYRYFQNINPLILKELTLKKNHSEAVEALLIQLSTSNSSVSVHIRRGDYVTDANANNFMGLLPLDYYNRAIEIIKIKIKKPVFYFFSDDLDWVKDNIRPKAETHFVDIDGGKYDYVDLDIMSKCAHNIIANSSYSWWGAFLNRNPDKIVIAPSKWVVPIDLNSRIEIQLPAWTKI